MARIGVQKLQHSEKCKNILCQPNAYRHTMLQANVDDHTMKTCRCVHKHSDTHNLAECCD